jgi:tetratricopeptide (TPR) repeat protein
VTNDLESYLVNQKVIAARNTPEPKNRWDLIVAQRGLVAESDRVLSQGEARILSEYLDAEDAKGKRIWLDWSKNHPSLAKVVWPAVAQVARQELYLFVPELLILARNATDAAQLQSEIDQLLADKYLAFGRIQGQLSNHEAAVELFTSALTHAPTRAEVFVARSKSLSSLGKKDKAAADQLQAERVQGQIQR